MLLLELMSPFLLELLTQYSCCGAIILCCYCCAYRPDHAVHKGFTEYLQN